MLRLILIYITLIFLNNHAKAIGAIPTKGVRYITKVGYKLTDLPFIEITSVTRITCTMKCALIERCVTIVYITGNENNFDRCQLFDFPATEETLVGDVKSTLMKKHEPISLVKEISLIGLSCNQKSDYQDFICSHAIDEIMEHSCNHNDFKCAHSLRRDYSWWQVDFGMQRTVTKVILYNRNVNPAWLNHFAIRVQDDPMPDNANSNSCVEDVPYDPELIRTLVCDSPVSGRYLVVQNGSVGSYLVLVEVRAFGY